MSSAGSSNLGTKGGGGAGRPLAPRVQPSAVLANPPSAFSLLPSSHACLHLKTSRLARCRSAWLLLGSGTYPFCRLQLRQGGEASRRRARAGHSTRRMAHEA